MGQAHKVCSQLFGPTEQRQRILATVCSSAAKRPFFMNANAPKKDGFAIQQNIRPPGFNSAETDRILHPSGFSFDHDFIKFWIGGRPKREAGGETYLRKPIRV